jgi:tRNA-dihydrouridine synthase
MLQNIPKMLEITKAVVDAVNIPVTVKTRLGWDHDSKIIVDLAEQLQDCGIAALTIHGRTRSQMYTGEADWTLIGEVKNNPRMHIPIIGNGDVTTPQQVKKYFDHYGVDAIMIGRASFGRPWIFKEVKHYLETGEELPPLTFEWRMDVLREQVKQSIERLDERRGIIHVRRHLAASPLFKGIPNFRDTRIAMLRANTQEELFTIFDKIIAEQVKVGTITKKLISYLVAIVSASRIEESFLQFICEGTFYLNSGSANHLLYIFVTSTYIKKAEINPVIESIR